MGCVTTELRDAMHRYLVTRKPELPPEATPATISDIRHEIETLSLMKTAWGVSNLQKKPSGRPSNQHVWDVKCVVLLNRLAASGAVGIESLPPKPLMPKFWDRNSPGPRVEILPKSSEPLPVTPVLDLGDDIDVELELSQHPKKKIKLHRSEQTKAFFFSLHETLRHKSMAEVRIFTAEIQYTSIRSRTGSTT